MTEYPELVLEFIKYLDYKMKFDKTGILDMSDEEFIVSTTLLPLSNIIINYPNQYRKPTKYPPSNYIDTIINPTSRNVSNSYAPIVQLPGNVEQAENYLDRVFAIQRHLNKFSISPFVYVVSELTDNIYQHARCSRAVVMGQRFDKKGYVDLSIYDNGITIPKIFEEKKPGLNGACEAIHAALGGVSTTHQDRGFGLSTSLNLLVQGLNSKFFIASGAGAIYCDRSGRIPYTLPDRFGLEGTLITIRLPNNAPDVDMYAYLNV